MALFDLLRACLQLASALDGPAPDSLPRTQPNAVVQSLQCLGELHIVLLQHAVALRHYVHSALALRELAADDSELATVLTSRHFPDGALLHALRLHARSVLAVS